MDGGPSSTGTLRAWREIQSRNPGARLVCLDIQPYATVQAPPSASVLHVGGFSDQVFRVVRSFLSASGPDHWVEAIDRINY